MPPASHLGLKGLHVEVADSVDALEDHFDGWYRLVDAVGAGRSAPAWLLAWWHHARPAGAALRVAVVRHGREVVAVAPYFAHRRERRRVEYRPLGPGFVDPVGVLAEPGVSREAAPLIAAALAARGPRPDVVTFEGIDARSPWPEALRRAWPTAVRPTRYVTAWRPVPFITLDAPDFDAWLKRRSSSFRGEIRKKRRRVERSGGHIRAVPPGDAAKRAIAAFVRFHHDRFAAAGGSSLPVAGLAALLEEAADALLPCGRMRLIAVELDDDVIGVQVALAAAGVVHAWSVAFSPEHARLSPGILATLSMVEDAFARGDRLLSLGSGAHPYKLRLADGVDAHAVLNGGFCLFSRRYPLTRLELLPAEAGAVVLRAAQTLPPERRAQLRAIRQRALSLRSRSA